MTVISVPATMPITLKTTEFQRSDSHWAGFLICTVIKLEFPGINGNYTGCF